MLSFSRLAHRVAIGCGGSARVYIDKPGRFLQLSLALEQVGGALSVYGGSARSPERMVQLLSALDELRFGCAAPDALRKAAESATPSLAGKLRDLALLQEALDALSAQSGADPAGRLDVLAEQLPGCAWLRSAKFYIDGFTDFTAQERRVIRALLPLADVTVCLTCDDLASGSEVFSLARRTMRALRDAAEEDGVAVEIVSVPRGEDRTPFAFLEENLFGWTDETCSAAGSIRLVRAPGVAAECELAARCGGSCAKRPAAGGTLPLRCAASGITAPRSRRRAAAPVCRSTRANEPTFSPVPFRRSSPRHSIFLPTAGATRAFLPI